MLNLHIENNTALGDVFEITQSRLDDALARYPDIAEQIRITIGYDGVEFKKSIKDADVLFGWDFERSNLVEIAPKLRWIQLQGAGVNHLLPLDWIPQNVTLTNSRGVHGKRASEYVMMAILALNNGLPSMVTSQRERRWHQIHNSVIEGKTLLIFGTGHIGSDVAAAAKYFGLYIIGIRRTGKPCENVDEMHRPEALHELVPRADFILITAPHTPSTNRIIDRKVLALMKQGAGLINYSRSRLLDYEALKEALDAGLINAVVDVFDEEPLPKSSPLWHTPNLIITPHSSSNDPVNHAARSLDLLFDNTRRFLKGESLQNIVDPALQY